MKFRIPTVSFWHHTSAAKSVTFLFQFNTVSHLALPFWQHHQWVACSCCCRCDRHTPSNMNLTLLVAFLLVIGAQLASSFSPLHHGTQQPRISAWKLKMALMVTLPPPAPVVLQQDISNALWMQDPGVLPSPLKQGIQQHVLATTPSSNFLSDLKPRHVPTAEEIAQKKFNFNLWLWGGGVVAPFLATFYYFGLKFWEK